MAGVRGRLSLGERHGATDRRDARADVAGPAHGRVNVVGLARLFPAHTVHAQQSTAVVTANDCALRSVDHYHVHRVSVSFDRLLLSDDRVRDELARLVLKPADAQRIKAFQRALQRVSTTDSNQPNTPASIPLHRSYVHTVTDNTVVLRGDRSRLNLRSRYVVEEAELPIVDLLAQDPALIQSFAEALAAPAAAPQTGAFLRDLLRAGGRTDDLALLAYASDLPTPDTWLFSLFGVARVDQASAVMIGSGNRLTTGLELDRPKVSKAGVLGDLAELRSELVPPTKPDWWVWTREADAVTPVEPLPDVRETASPTSHWPDFPPPPAQPGQPGPSEGPEPPTFGRW
jgi:hypothetical protein